MRNPFALSGTIGDDVPRQIFGYRIYLVAFSATWASAMYGYDSAFIGGTLSLPAFQTSFGLDPDSSEYTNLSSNIVSTFQAGAFFGAIFGFFLAERFGRKPTILLSGVIFSIGVILQLIGRIGLLYGGRALTGLGIGATSMIIPIYISECSPALIRGRMVGMFEIMLQIALVFGFWVNYGVNKNISGSTAAQWRIPVGIQLIPAGLLLMTMSLMIESPRWMVSKDRTEKALKALSWVRNIPPDHPYIQHELSEIQAGVEHEIQLVNNSRSSWQVLRECATPGVRSRIIISVLMMLLQNLTGINAINYYSPTIFKSIGFTGTSVGLLATGVYGLVKMVTTIVFMVFIVDKLGRRPALLVGAVGAAVAMLYLGIYSELSDSFDKVPAKDSGANTAVAMIYIYAIFYGFSWNGIPWIFASEVLPTRVRTLGMMFSTCMQWLAQFMIVYSLPHMVASIKFGIFYFFAACTIAALIFAYLFVPETKGVSLEEMGLLFGEDVSVWASKAWKHYQEFRETGMTVSELHGVEKGNKVDKHEFWLRGVWNTMAIDDSFKSNVFAAGTAEDLKIENLGYQQELRRSFGFFDMVGFSFNVVTWFDSWTALSAVFIVGVNAGGPPVMIYGWIGVCMATMLVALSMAEMCARWPLAGGQYSWVALMAPSTISRQMSYITGWFMLMGVLAMGAVNNSILANFVLGQANVVFPEYSIQRWHTVLVSYAVAVVALAVNIWAPHLLSRLSRAILWWNIGSFITVTIVLLVTNRHKQDAEFVFKDFQNETGFGPAIATIIGILQSFFGMCCYETPSHMSEEMMHASRDAPRAIIMTVLIGAATGFVFLVTLCFCIGDISTTADSQTGVPVIQIFYDSTGSKVATCCLATLFDVIVIFCAVSLVAEGSRMIFAFARDHGLPFSGILSRVNRKKHVPIYAIITTVVIQMAFNSIYFGTVTGFNTIISISTTGFYVSYALVVLARILGYICGDRTATTFSGPYSFSVPVSLTLNSIGFVFLVFAVITFNFPSEAPVDEVSMNYTSAAIGVIALLSILTWITTSYRHFRGPADAQGGRDDQEDRFTIVFPTLFSKDISNETAFFAVYDGHGGADTANFASQRLHTILKNQPSFRTGDYKTAIESSLAEVDKQFFDLGKLGKGDPVTTGSTVALCLVNLTTSSAVVANLGDSHVLLGEQSMVYRGCSVRRLSKAHKPEEVDERIRIERAGGRINTITGQPRVGKAFGFDTPGKIGLVVKLKYRTS
ncbi:putative quinate permease [Talaromyces islandicus]|uniref:Quinate transporter n=1 Tax=Talaromyces islandicus TaxID=28573 RepID=A0A0U1LUB5_TALIS|nr:putative quinate permease [Talaromyces islandicus]